MAWPLTPGPHQPGGKAHEACEEQEGGGEGQAVVGKDGVEEGQGTPGQGASRLENFLASHLELVLQSRKNGLGSAKIGHVVMEGQFEDFLQQFFPLFHFSLLMARLSFYLLPGHDMYLP